MSFLTKNEVFEKFCLIIVYFLPKRAVPSIMESHSEGNVPNNNPLPPERKKRIKRGQRLPTWGSRCFIKEWVHIFYKGLQPQDDKVYIHEFCYATKSSRPDHGAPVDLEGILQRPWSGQYKFRTASSQETGL